MTKSGDVLIETRKAGSYRKGMIEGLILVRVKDKVFTAFEKSIITDYMTKKHKLYPPSTCLSDFGFTVIVYEEYSKEELMKIVKNCISLLFEFNNILKNVENFESEEDKEMERKINKINRLIEEFEKEKENIPEVKMKENKNKIYETQIKHILEKYRLSPSEKLILITYAKEGNEWRNIEQLSQQTKLSVRTVRFATKELFRKWILERKMGLTEKKKRCLYFKINERKLRGDENEHYNK